MRMKGIAVKAVKEFIKKQFSDEYDEWLKNLSEESKDIVMNAATGELYDIEDAIVKPTRIACRLFYSGDVRRCAWELGKFSAEYAAKGIYKILIRMKSPEYIVKKTTFMFSSYYDEGSIRLEKKE